MSYKVYTEVARFPSSSSAGKVYVVKEDQDGNLSCDCPAWRFKKGATRTCKHVQAVASGATPPPIPTPQAVEVKPTEDVVEGLMADIEKARAAKASGTWKGLTQALEELDKERTEGG